MPPRHVSCAIALSLACSIAAAGEPCEDNFSVKGNLLTGKTYNTIASIPNASPRDAFDGALQFTTSNGFTALSSDKNAGSISAAQTVNMRNGKNVPLTIAMKADGANTTIAMSYLTPTGVMSPDEAIKKHFCATVAAAAGSARLAATAPIAVAAPAPHQPHQHTPPPRPIQRGAPVGYAVITDDQKKAVETALMKNVPNDRIREMVKEAAPAVTLMAERMGCLASDAGTSAMNEFLAPNGWWSRVGITVYPMGTMSIKYHDKSSCLTVVRITAWNAPANNVLTYQVFYKADDSGESAIREHEVIRQTDGTWLFNK